MTRTEFEELFARRVDASNRHDSAALMGDYAEDCALVSPMAGSVSGRVAIEEVFRAWFTSFPDVFTALDALIVEGDRVVELATISGTDTGGFMGLPPTQKTFALPIVRLYTFRGREIVHERRVYDFTGMLVRIGALKAKPA